MTVEEFSAKIDQARDFVKKEWPEIDFILVCGMKDIGFYAYRSTFEEDQRGFLGLKAIFDRDVDIGVERFLRKGYGK